MLYPFGREKKDMANAARLKFTSRDGDHLTLLNVMRAFLEVPRKHKGQWCSDNFLNIRSLGKAQDIYEQLQRHAVQLGLPCISCGTNFDAVRRALVTGLFINSARIQSDGTFKVSRVCMCVANLAGGHLLEHQHE